MVLTFWTQENQQSACASSKRFSKSLPFGLEVETRLTLEVKKGFAGLNPVTAIQVSIYCFFGHWSSMCESV